MNRKSLPVSSSTIRRRTSVDVGKRLEQIRDEDDYLSLTDMNTETGLNDRHENDSVGLLEGCLSCANDTSGIAAGAVFHEEEGGTEFESDYTEGLLASGSDSSEPEDEIYETSLSDKIADWARHFGISLVALSALLGILRLSHPDLPKDGRTLLRTKTKYSIQEKAGGKYYYFGIIHSQIGTAYQQSAFRDTYMEARQILKKALTCSTSDLQTEDEQEQSGRRRTTAKHFFGDRDVEEDYRPPKRFLLWPRLVAKM
ncbi:hypothetical protein R3I93_021590 [Phoxinus phoxinus]|uniref:Uncharacterized protein n=1 Tax=Phoxinus phoxinus TaxID=58324 RepID=A0AAN9CAC2_9TELE